MEIKKIETYSLYEFCQAVQQAVIEGWRFDFNSNELFPTMYGSMLITGMVKDNTEVKSKDNTEVIIENNADNTENKSEVKRGRKPKDNT
jgi:hypothetical protein